VELRQCTGLQSLSLENNRLATPVMDVSRATGLRSLQVRVTMLTPKGAPAHMRPADGIVWVLPH
jgi:hypothetical protein